MHRILLTTLILLGALLTPALHAAPPGNDDFAQAFILTGLPTSATGSNVDATVQVQEPDNLDGEGGESVWWEWTAPTSGWVEVNTLGSSFDTMLAVYSGSTLSDLTRLAFNDDDPLGQSSQSRIKFLVSEGTHYHLQVQGYSAEDEGAIALAIRPIDAPQLPVLTRLTWEANSVDVSERFRSHSAEVSFTAPSGLTPEDGYSGIVIRLTSPSGDVLRSQGDYRLTSGTLNQGVAAVNLYIPEGREPGEWQVSVRLQDQAGISSSYGGTGVGVSPFPTGSSSTLTLINTGVVDREEPVLTAVTITPLTVDVGVSAQNVIVRASASDDRRIDSLYISLGGLPGGPDGVEPVRVALVSGTFQNGVWETEFTIPRFTLPKEFPVRIKHSDIIKCAFSA